MASSRTILMVAVAGLLALGASGSFDYAMNDARLIYAALGRDTLVEACTPALVRELMQQGFSPQDVEIDGRPALGFTWGRGRSIDAGFTFQDGGAATRVDGRMTCTVEPQSVRVVFRTMAKPIRVG